MTTHSVVAWSLVLGLGLAGAFYAAVAREPVGLLASAAFTTLLLAVVGVNERRALVRQNAPASRIESATARYMSFVWLWGAAALIAIYVFVLSWREWTHFSAAFLVAGALCFGFSRLLDRDAAAGRDDATLLTLGRYLGIGQVGGMLATIVGLAVDPDKEFLSTGEHDWAGNGIFLFGALALAILSAHALLTATKNPPEADRGPATKNP
jgi:hypothetical protein